MQLIVLLVVLLTVCETRGQISSLPPCSSSNLDPIECILDHVTMKIEQLAAYNSVILTKLNEFQNVVLKNKEESCSSSATHDQNFTATCNQALLLKVEEILSSSDIRDQALLHKVEEILSTSATRDHVLLLKVEEAQLNTTAHDQVMAQKLEEMQSLSATRDQVLLPKVEEILSTSATRDHTLLLKVEETRLNATARDHVLLQKLEELQSISDTRNQDLLQKIEEVLSTSTTSDQILIRKVEELENKLEEITRTIEENNRMEPSLNPNCVFSNCLEIFNHGYQVSGVYTIYAGQEAFQVFCDMQASDGGPGWIVFQQRKDGTVSFNRTWEVYRNGFGDLVGEHWLGNRYLELITQSNVAYELRIDLLDWDGARRYAQYSYIRIMDELEDFKLILGSFSGDVGGDSMAHHNNSRFSTPDRDNDSNGGIHCAQRYRAGWWYSSSCGNVGLNNPYHNSSRTGYGEGIFWLDWHFVNYSFKEVQMKIRPVLA